MIVLPVTKYAESALKAQSQTHCVWPVSVLSSTKLDALCTFQIFTVESAEAVASNLSAHRVSDAEYR